MVIVIAFITIWYLSLFAQSFFHHRYASHRAFTMSKGWERVFFIYSYLVQGSHYLSPKAYAIMHRMHHAHTDTDQDPHSPSYSSNIFSMMLRTRRFYNDIIEGKIKVDPQYAKNVPEWEWFDKWADSRISRFIWVGIYTTFFILFATHWTQFLLLPVLIALAAVHGAIINWFAHRHGYINYIMKNTSRNLLFIDVLMLGESYHNNHHKYPSSANFGKRWHEIDPLYPVIKLLARMRVIKMR